MCSVQSAKLKKPEKPACETRSTRLTRSTQPVVTTRFRALSLSPSPDEFMDDDYSDSASIPTPHTSTAARKRKNNHDDYPQRPQKVQRRTRAQTSIKESQTKAVTPRTPSSTATTPTAFNSTPSSYPPWVELPYLVLLCIFDKVAAPIRDPSSRREDVSEAVSTLLSASRTCTPFAEPALAALYRCPPFYHQWRYTKDPFTSMNQFITTLNMDPADTKIKYRPKIETLLIEVGSALAPKYQTNYLGLQNAIPLLKSLSRVDLYHVSDEPPYRSLDETVRFKCNANDTLKMLAGSEQHEVRPRELKSWRWNSRLTDDTLSLEKLEEFHLHPSFASLQKVAFVNYQIASWGLPMKAQLTEEMERKNYLKMVQLSACISALPNLQHLILESSTLVTGSLLNRLPVTLQHLELINCWEVVADDLASFLLTHGHHLRSLTINHCQSLSLAFLPILQSACPKLECLYMDLSYFRHHEHYADNKPEYDTLLEEHQVPAWPASIQSIEILHMRKWDFKAAEMFFGSLVQSAPNLPNLRRIAFRVALDIGWRQRQELREFWVEKMVGVFKRKIKSAKDMKVLSLPPTKSDGQDEKEFKNTKALSTPKRRSTRIANITPTPTSSEGEMGYLSKAQLARASAISKELQRLRGSGLLLKERLLREQDADDEDSEDELAADHSDQSGLNRKVRKVSKHVPNDDEFIHGMCDVVDIQVDNHRPTERHFDMEDFLDSEDESDEEWDGGDADVFD
ncbi:uncharacterized protein GGS22DRAFT_179894 [Annulohypoxylon maeteangense]|uniref:uncharacterized protein n=1 Tax=Annulohypoxylon maeteangense TaxID=1927788 RepID=UPI0020077F88|nr:uncharacterized protein GGS22DRAFT_179894 [Annulohypoxylon maeteangense]KAI0885384.1 hypothetical protein GGS22DRAFT_179894 [Annulohypoxylon maeteangense]